MFKYCPRCKRTKNIDDFGKDSHTKDGFSSYCKECRRKLAVKYSREHKEQKKKYMVMYRKEHKEQAKEWMLQHPWCSHYYHAKRRCLNPNHSAYKYYGGRGIKFLCSVDDFKKVWFRDKAYLLGNPTIDRIDNNGNYELDNIRFIESVDNIAKSWKERRTK